MVSVESDVELLFAHARRTRETSIALRAARETSRARWDGRHLAARLAIHACLTEGAVSMARAYRERQRSLPRMFTLAQFGGGASMLAGTRILLVSDDPDTLDLIRLVLGSFGVQVMTASVDEVTASLPQHQPAMVLIDLPFERQIVFATASHVRALSRADGHGPVLVALTKHHHDHPVQEALAAGFHAQINEPIEPNGLESSLVGLLRRAA
jgi:CheY-like chemotaxis protein